MKHCTDCKYYAPDEQDVLQFHKCTAKELNETYCASWAVTGKHEHLLSAIIARQTKEFCGITGEHFEAKDGAPINNIRHLQPVATALSSVFESSVRDGVSQSANNVNSEVPAGGEGVRNSGLGLAVCGGVSEVQPEQGINGSNDDACSEVGTQDPSPTLGD